jgi:hypothetical protein
MCIFRLAGRTATVQERADRAGEDRSKHATGRLGAPLCPRLGRRRGWMARRNPDTHLLYQQAVLADGLAVAASISSTTHLSAPCVAPSCLVCVCIVTRRFAYATGGVQDNPPPLVRPPLPHASLHAPVVSPTRAKSIVALLLLPCIPSGLGCLFFPSSLSLLSSLRPPQHPSCSSTFLVPRQHHTSLDPFRQSGIMT